MKNLRFVVKVNRGGSRAPSYVQRVDPAPIQVTTNPCKLALLMGRFTAERCCCQIVENLSVQPGIGVRPGPGLSASSNN